MNDLEIFASAMRKAESKGWISPEAYNLKFVDGKILSMGDKVIMQVQRIFAKSVIFDHDFAKALWGHEQWYFTENGDWVPESAEDSSQYLMNMDAWQYHIHQMALAENPFKYLGENI